MNHLFTIKTLSYLDWRVMLSLIIISMTGMLTLVTCSLKDGYNKHVTPAIFIFGTILSAFSLGGINFESGYSILNGVLYYDSFSQFFVILMLIAAVMVTILELSQREDDRQPLEFFSLLAFALAGMQLMVSTQDMMIMFIGIELMSLSTYVLIAMKRNCRDTSEASLKYFILGGVASGILLFGMSFIFGQTGSFLLTEIKPAITIADSLSPIMSFGILLLSVGLLFKVGAFPFHTWLPDVYTGAVNSITAFMITAIKVAGFGLLVRVYMSIGHPLLFAHTSKFYQFMFAVISLSLLFGSFAGLKQNNLKRIFAYSSIAHTGFILLAAIALNGDQGELALRSISAYLLFYVVTGLGAFAVLQSLSTNDNSAFDLENLSGLFKRSPLLAIALTIFLLSMAGFPPTCGFFGKYYVIVSAFQSGESSLAVIAIISSIFSAYFYLRPITYMFFRPVNQEVQPIEERSGLMGVVISSMILVFVLPIIFKVII